MTMLLRYSEHPFIKIIKQARVRLNCCQDSKKIFFVDFIIFFYVLAHLPLQPFTMDSRAKGL